MFVSINSALNDRSAASNKYPLFVPFNFQIKGFETLVKCNMSKYGTTRVPICRLDEGETDEE